MPRTRFDRTHATGSSLFHERGVVWKIHGSPVATLVGGLRALLIQALHPRAMAGVSAHSGYQRDPWERARRTYRYIATVTFGSSDDAVRESARVRGLHDRVRGIDPNSGRPYSANDPDLLLWVHCVAYHSFLTAYRRCIGGLSDEDSDHYLCEVRRASALLGLDPSGVPRSRGEMREYFASIRELEPSPAARRVFETVVRPPIPAPVRPLWGLPAGAAIALLPRDLRGLYGIDQPGSRDRVGRLAVAPLSRVCNAVFPTQYLVNRLRKDLAAARSADGASATHLAVAA